MEKLSQYEFEDEAAQEAFNELMQEFNDIRSVEDFQRRYKDLFNGPQSLDYPTNTAADGGDAKAPRDGAKSARRALGEDRP